MILGIFIKNKEKGQSFVELILIFPILMLLLAGMAEFGNLLNDYINLVDGAREGARFGSDFDPYIRIPETCIPPVICCSDPPCDNETYFLTVSNLVEQTMRPVTLDTTSGDDVIISLYSVDSYLGNTTPGRIWKKFNNQETRFTVDIINSRLVNTAPNTGILVVEVYYHYDQILKLISYLGLPDPVAVYTYAIMPITAVEPVSNNLFNPQRIFSAYQPLIVEINKMVTQ